VVLKDHAPEPYASLAEEEASLIILYIKNLRFVLYD
jgi:hypothetical protein